MRNAAEIRPGRALALVALVAATAATGWIRAGDPGSASIQAGSPGAVRAAVRPSRVRAGDTINVVISASGLRDAGAVSFHLVFDPSVFEPIPSGFTEGVLMRQGGAATAFLARTASTGDRVVVGVSRLGAPRGARGGGVLCRLAFRARAPGSTAFVFDRAQVSAPDASAARVRFVPARVIVGAAAPAGTTRGGG